MIRALELLFQGSVPEFMLRLFKKRARNRHSRQAKGNKKLFKELKIKEK
jgi:hypothetical protein